MLNIINSFHFQHYLCFSDDQENAYYSDLSGCSESSPTKINLQSRLDVVSEFSQRLWEKENKVIDKSITVVAIYIDVIVPR